MSSPPNLRQISGRAFHFCRMDLATLRNQFARTQDIPMVTIGKLPRSKLINGMLAHEFGVDAVIDHVAACAAWNRDKALVEGR